MAEPTKLPVKKKTIPAVVGRGSWNPFDALRREVDQAFQNFGLGALPLALTQPMFQGEFFRDRSWNTAPAVDVIEKDKEFEITAELPGMDESNIDVKFSDGTLTIKGEKRDDKEEKKKGYYLSERRYGSFQRSFQLPEGVDVDKIDASFTKGILTVKLPKTAEAQKAEKKITVKAA